MAKTILGFYRTPLTLNEKDLILSQLIPRLEAQTAAEMSSKLEREFMACFDRDKMLSNAYDSTAVRNARYEYQFRLVIDKWADSYPTIRELKDSSKYYCTIGEVDKEQPNTLQMILSPALKAMFNGTSNFKPDLRHYHLHDNENFLVEEINKVVAEQAIDKRNLEGSKQSPIDIELLDRANRALIKLMDKEEINRFHKHQEYDFSDFLTEFVHGHQPSVATPFYPELIDRYSTTLKEAKPLVGEDKNTDHLLWMLNKILTDQEMSETKKFRWLGYIQGIMVAEGLLSVSKERDLTRPLFKGK